MMPAHAGHLIVSVLVLLQAPRPQPPPAVSETVTINAGGRTLHGVLYRPVGPGPFPAVLYNHGSAPGTLNDQAFEVLGPLFVSRGWVFFAPYRRGQGLSASAGPYIGDQIADARRRRFWQGGALAVPLLALTWFGLWRRQPTGVRPVVMVAVALYAAWAINVSAQRAAASTMVRLLDTEQFSDQLAALQWLQHQPLVQPDRIATAGNSFGGVEAILGAERAHYCAVVDAAGGAESWAVAPGLRALMEGAVRRARAPVFFIQAENDYDLSPSRSLAKAMHDVGKDAEVKIYPKFGRSPAEGHSFAWRGTDIWGADVIRFLSKHCGG
jgi:dipeptidyl aminopeptidase/acylaminoacyl peptidase